MRTRLHEHLKFYVEYASRAHLETCIYLRFDPFGQSFAANTKNICHVIYAQCRPRAHPSSMRKRVFTRTLFFIGNNNTSVVWSTSFIKLQQTLSGPSPLIFPAAVSTLARNKVKVWQGSTPGGPPGAGLDRYPLLC